MMGPVEDHIIRNAVEVSQSLPWQFGYTHSVEDHVLEGLGQFVVVGDLVWVTKDGNVRMQSFKSVFCMSG